MTDNIVVGKSPAGRYLCFSEILGRGAYKIVYRGYDTRNGIEVAWNSISIQNLNETEQKSIIKEINMLKELSPQNNNIVKFFNAWKNHEKNVIVFITEIALSGTLFDYIKRINNINMRVIKKWCRQILEALAFLHDRQIAHRDLKCSNIFINSNTGNIMIGDFGLATQRFTGFHTVIGTPEYMAPEMYEEDYDEQVDIYAFGCSLLEMITKEVPYNECKSFGQIYRKVTHGQFPDSLDTIKNEKAKNLILRCIQRDPKTRPSAIELLEDPFLKFFEDDDDDHNLLKEAIAEAGILSTEKDKSLVLDTQESMDEETGVGIKITVTDHSSHHSSHSSGSSDSTGSREKPLTAHSQFRQLDVELNPPETKPLTVEIDEELMNRIDKEEAQKEKSEVDGVDSDRVCYQSDSSDDSDDLILV